MADANPTTEEPVELQKVIVTGKSDPVPSMREMTKDIVKQAFDRIEAYANDPSQVERDLEGGGILGGIAGAFLKSQASKPGFKSNSFTIMAEMLPLVPEMMQHNPYQKDFPDLVKQGKEAFEATGLTQGDFDQMAAQARVRSDAALREWGEKIIVGFGQTSDDPYIARRQENALREQIQEAGEVNKSLNEAQARADEAAKKVDKAWAKDGAAVQNSTPAEPVSPPTTAAPAAPATDAGQTR